MDQREMDESSALFLVAMTRNKRIESYSLELHFYVRPTCHFTLPDVHQLIHSWVKAKTRVC